MLLEGRRHDNDIVKKNQTGFPGESLHDQIHQSLKDCGRVRQSERQDLEFESTFLSDEGGFVGSLRVISNLPVTLSQI